MLEVDPRFPMFRFKPSSQSRAATQSLPYSKRNTQLRLASGTRHFCGEGHAGINRPMILVRDVRHQNRISENGE